MKRFLSFLFVTMLTAQAWAESFEKDGLYYYITSSIEPYTVQVIKHDSYLNLTAAEIPETVNHNGIDYAVTSIAGSAFRACSMLQDVTIPKSVTSIGKDAFAECFGVKTLTYNTDALFSFPSNAGSLFVNLNDPYFWLIYSEEDQHYYQDIMASLEREGFSFHTKFMTSLETINIGDDVTFIGPLFSDRPSIKTVNIGNSVTAIATNAFNGCTGLTSIDIPESVTAIGYNAFNGVGYLTYSGIAEGGPWGAIGILDGDFVYSDVQKTKLIQYIGKGEDVVIPNSVTSIDNGAFYGCSGIKTLTYNTNAVNTATNIIYLADQGCYSNGSLDPGNEYISLFADMTSLETVNIGDDVTVIGGGLFAGLTSIKTINIGSSVTSIGLGAFAGCSGLESITIPESVTTIGSEAFSGCSSLTSVEIPNFVTSIGSNVFNGCSGIKTLTYNTDAVNTPVNNSTNNNSHHEPDDEPDEWFDDEFEHFNNNNNSNGVFFGMTSLETVNIGDAVTSVGDGLFSGLTSIKTINIGGSVETIGKNAFNGCSGITSIELPNTVTSIGNSAFNGCSGLLSFDIPEMVTTIGNNAFSGCASLTSIEIPETVTSIGITAFSDCSGIKTLTYNTNAVNAPVNNSPNNSHHEPDNEPDDWFDDDFEEENNYNSTGSLFSGMTSLETVNIGNAVTEIGRGLFAENTSIKTINIGLHVTNISDGAFYNCSGLLFIEIPELVTSVGNNAFAGCNGLSSITIPQTISTIGSNAFNGCNNLTSIIILTDANVSKAGLNFTKDDLKYSVLSKNTVSVLPSTYSGNVTMPETVTAGNTFTVIKIGNGTFRGCEDLTSITLPESLAAIDDNAFDGCSNLLLITIPESVRSIGSNAFNGCSSLAAIVIPDSVRTIGNNAFAGCAKIVSVVIPDSVKSIGGSAFSNCSKLENITFGNSVAEIGTAILAGCGNLQSIECKSEIPPTVGGNMFTGNSLQDAIIYDNVRFVYPEGARMYRKMQPWSNFDATFMATVSVTSANPTMGMAIGNGSYMIGTSTEIAAIEKLGHHFVGWSDGNTDNPRSISINGDATYTAEFAVNVYNITVIADNGTVSGAGKYNHGSRVTLTATPNTGYHFVRWSNGGINSTTSINVTEDLELEAEFAINVYNITAIAENGMVTGSGEYNHGSDVTLTASANAGYHFVKWQDNEDAEATRIVSVTESKKYTALFEAHTESVVFENEVAPTCTASGSRDSVVYCTVCQAEVSRTKKEIAKLAHTEVTDAAKAPTCTETGLTEGKHCSVCNTVLVKQETVPALGHKEVVDAAVAATCTEAGKTEGKHCSVCNTVLVAQQEVAALGHKEVVDAAVAATCTEAGKTEGKHCSVCNTVLVKQETVPALGHKEVVDAAVAATCTEAGKTEGKHCSVCNAVLVAQEETAALGHTEVVDAAVAATCTEAGKTEGKHCSVCNEVLVAQETVAALGHTEVTDDAVAATCTEAGKTEGKHCSVCNAVLVAQQEIAALGHTEVTDAAVAATCFKTGLSEGKHCSVCNAVLVAQETIPALGHEFKTYVYNNDATTEADGTETAVCEHGCGATDTRVAVGTKLPKDNTAIADDAANAVSIYAHHNIIVVENADAEIRVYNAMGALVATANDTNAEIRINVSGVYVVRVGNTAKRVMVN